ncbi:M20/M25/M40 family metallo-hydrolase [Planctomycetota bacterium]|nr:M20/M25/M40 family metallo-hydrolase [Planctomycetota bacterium]
MNTQLLETLTTIPGVAGREHRIRQFILDQTKDIFDETSVDDIGNLHGLIRSKSSNPSPKKVMIAAHMDQIGFFVRHIDDKGYVYLQNIGMFDPRNLFARMVTICPDLNDPSKDITATMNPSGLPIHLSRNNPESQKKIPEVSEFIVDTGLPIDQVKAKLKVGDMAILKAPLYEVGDLIVAQCLDNRVSCYIAAEALKQVNNNDCEIHMVFTVQEEVGLRGAGPATYAIRPDIAISLDTTCCCDIPGVASKDYGSILGDGVGLTIMDGAAIVDIELLEEFESLANANGIKAQRSMLYSGGTDAGPMQKSDVGHRIMTLLTPVKHIHTVTETIHRDDVDAGIKLLKTYLETVK